MWTRVVFIVLVLSLTIGLSVTARAADTVETYDEGAVDFEFYLGGDGLNLPKYEKTVFSNVLVGYGLLPRLSGYISLGAESDEYLTYGQGGYSFGVFGTPLDTDHFDIDLMMDVGMSGESLNAIGVTPALELNFDLRPDMELWGLYVRLEDGLAGRDESVADDPATPDIDETETRYEFTQSLSQTYGTYFTIAERHQILAEYYYSYNTNPARGELRSDSGGFALGYNVSIVDNLELITQVNCHPGHDHQDATWGASVGIIVGIPKTKQ